DGKDLVAGVEQLVTGLLDEVDRLEAGHFLGGAGVDVLDLGVRVGAAKDDGVQHTGAVDVEAVFGPAGGLFGAVEAVDARAEQAGFFGPGDRHGSASLLAQGRDGVSHLFVGAAAADVAGERLFHFRGGDV